LHELKEPTKETSKDEWLKIYEDSHLDPNCGFCTNENFKPNENHSMQKMVMIPNEILMFGVGAQSKLL